MGRYTIRLPEASKYVSIASPARKLVALMRQIPENQHPAAG
jgi:hypothetical protein